MKVLVTGANGLLATNTIIELLEQGYKVKGLVRNKSKFVYHQHPNLELFVGDITNLSDTELASKDCNYVIHAAANTNQNLLKLSDYLKVNVIGTENILKGCIKNNVKKLIFISTANTFGYGSKNDPGNESKKIKLPFSNAFYAISKLEAQNSIWKATDKLEIVTIHPTFMIGAYDSKPSSGRIILMGLKKYLLFYPPGGKNFVPVKDTVKGVIKAIEKGRNGESYLLAGENLSYKEFFKKVNLRSKDKPLLIKIPKFVLLFIGLIGDQFRKFGIRTNLSSTNMQILCIENFYSNKKAIDELQMSFSPIEDAIEDAISWFKKNGKLDE